MALLVCLRHSVSLFSFSSFGGAFICAKGGLCADWEPRNCRRFLLRQRGFTRDLDLFFLPTSCCKRSNNKWTRASSLANHDCCAQSNPKDQNQYQLKINLIIVNKCCCCFFFYINTISPRLIGSVCLSVGERVLYTTMGI